MSAPSSLVYDSAGDPQSPPILLIHGLLAHRRIWRSTIPALQDRFYCINPDLLGFGDSPKPEDGDYSIRAHAERVLALADQLGLEKFSLFGHSMGGQICACLAGRLAPERVSKLIIVGGVLSGKLNPYLEVVIRPMVRMGAFYPPLMKIMAPLMHWSAYRHLVFRTWFYDMDAMPLADWELDRRMATLPEIARPATRTWDSLSVSDQTDALPQIQAHTLGIYGRQEATVLFSDGELLAQKVPGAQLAVIEKCGHFPMFEHPQEYLGLVEKHMA